MTRAVDPVTESERVHRVAEAVRELRGLELDDTLKGMALGQRFALGELGRQGWNVADGDVSLPVLTLERDAVADNLAAMAKYCARAGVRLAPHGKTTMAPQLFAAQLRHGAWAITAATPTQAAVMRRFGVSRIILANEVPDPAALTWMAHETAADPTVEFFCLVDDPEAVATMDAVLADAGPAEPLRVLVEIGGVGGRAGARTLERALEVARAVRRSSHLELAGVEAFEGTVASDLSDAALATVDRLCHAVRAATVAISAAGLFETPEIIVTAGGSAYFDQIVAQLSTWPEVDGDVALVLRSGCYVSHDAGKYERQSPLAGRRGPGESLRLRNALTLWARVLSRPEPGLVVVGAGLRDAPVDVELPRPRAVVNRRDGSRELGGRAASHRVMDQHLFISIPDDDPVTPGDIMSFDLSHPCTAFDKFRLIPVVDPAGTIVDAIVTFF